MVSQFEMPACGFVALFWLHQGVCLEEIGIIVHMGCNRGFVVGAYVTETLSVIYEMILPTLVGLLNSAPTDMPTLYHIC